MTLITIQCQIGIAVDINRTVPSLPLTDATKTPWHQIRQTCPPQAKMNFVGSHTRQQ